MKSTTYFISPLRPQVNLHNDEESREAVENFRAFLSILREWVDEERKERARRVVESASSEE